MKAILTIRKPRTAVEGWTGYVTNPQTGEKVSLITYCGGASVAFNTKDALVKEAKRVIRRWSQ